jgi:alkylglycerol monooxygenase
MNAYGNMLLIAMPIFLALIIFEQLWGWFSKKEIPNFIDTISSLSSGMTNILKATLGLTLVVISYPWLVKNLAIFHLSSSSFGTYALVFIFLDFTGYWVHRLNHRVNIFWNHHIIHHSSEEFNLPCALRQQISVFTNIFSFLSLPLAILGVAPEVIAVVAPIHLFTQFWYHTKYIDKMGFLEYFLVTPSHHRVHHAMNDQYMDKNYGQIFIIWDKFFGTFQPELKEENCVYGIRRPSQTWNPFLINFQHLWLLTKDAWQTKNIADKLKIWFMPTGWRPADVAITNPVYSIKNMDELKKYAPTYPSSFVVWSILHLLVIFILICFLFFRFGEIDQKEMMIYGSFIFVSIFSFTALLDKKKYGFIAFIISSSSIIAYIVYTNDWFGVDQLLSSASWIIVCYFELSLAIASYFIVAKKLRID